MKRLMIATAALSLLATAASAQSFVYTWTPAGTLAPTPPAPEFLMFAGAGMLVAARRKRRLPAQACA